MFSSVEKDALLRRINFSIHTSEVIHLYVVSKNTGYVIGYRVGGTSKAVAVALIYYISDKEHTLVRYDVLQFAIYTNISR